jgi:hypothetical protein
MADEKLDLVELGTVAGELKAGMIKSHLESEGIPVHLKYESIGRVLGLTVNGLGQVKILVPAKLANDARELINFDDL